MSKKSKNLSVDIDSCKRLEEISDRLMIKQSVIFEYLIDEFYFRKYHNSDLKIEIGDRSILDLFQI